MSTETNLVAIDSSKRQMTPAVSTATPSAGAIAFRERLVTEIRATTVNPNTNQTENSSLTGSSNRAFTAGATTHALNPSPNKAVPFYDRLYGQRGLPQVSGVFAPTGTISGTGVSTAKAENTPAHHRILSFADAIRQPASIAAMELGTSTNTVIAFAGLETGWGKHIPATDDTNSNNLFGIKAHSNTRASITNSTTEYIDGEPQTFDQQFRSYQSIGDSIADFSHFLRSNPRYDEALSHADNPEQFIRKVHEAGYATDPDYANKVIGALQQLDNITTKTGAIGIGWR